MKPIDVLYATREGQTQRIAEQVAAILRVRGLTVNVQNVQHLPPTFNLDGAAAVVLAASVHAGEHESEMVRFVKKHVVQLDHLPTAFLSVTLSEAGAERRDATTQEHARFETDVNNMLDHFFERTGWHPKHVKPVAGALLYTKYNFIVRFIMKRIARKAGAATDTSRDYEYTDWLSLNRFTDQFADELCRDRKHDPSLSDRETG
jgi:menaquinone-dependent protoporphyrinogen oxidase